jgi:hypothetical protein
MRWVTPLPVAMSLSLALTVIERVHDCQWGELALPLLPTGSRVPLASPCSHREPGGRPICSVQSRQTDK